MRGTLVEKHIVTPAKRSVERRSDLEVAVYEVVTHRARAKGRGDNVGVVHSMESEECGGREAEAKPAGGVGRHRHSDHAAACVDGPRQTVLRPQLQ